MPRRKVKYRPLQKFSIGDMRDIIKVHVRSITTADYDGFGFSESYDAGADEWARVTTPAAVSRSIGRNLFDDVNLPEGTTHIFTIRFNENYTSENIIKWEDDAYKILSVNDPDNRHEYLEMYARLMGDDDLSANT